MQSGNLTHNLSVCRAGLKKRTQKRLHFNGEIGDSKPVDKSGVHTLQCSIEAMGYYLGHFWQADLGYIGQAIIGVPNSSHVASIKH